MNTEILFIGRGLLLFSSLAQMAVLVDPSFGNHGGFDDETNEQNVENKKDTSLDEQSSSARRRGVIELSR